MKTCLKFALLFLVAAFFASIGRTEGPPQCNLPGWNTRQPCVLCQGKCECTDCDCEQTVKVTTKPVKKSRPAITFVAAKNGQHSHTCENPKCPFTATGFKYSWTHEQHKGHHCPYCSAEQAVLDQPARGTTVLVDQTAISKAPYAAQTFAPVRTVVTRSVRSSGCPNGNCPYVR